MTVKQPAKEKDFLFYKTYYEQNEKEKEKKRKLTEKRKNLYALKKKGFLLIG